MADFLDRTAPALMEIAPQKSVVALRAAGTSIVYDDGELIHSRGDRKPGVSIVETGAVNIGIIGRNGAFHTVTVLGPGHCFGEHALFAGSPRTHDVSSIGRSTVLQIKGARFLALFEKDAELARAIMTVTASRANALLDILDDIRRLDLSTRLAKLLLSFAPIDAPAASINCVQTDLAFSLGVSRVSLGKALKRLEKLGLVVVGYGYVEMPDICALENWATRNG